jgi:uncharacterized protein YciI
VEFLVIAYDGKDPGAKARRLAARPAHMKDIQPLIERGEFINGGAILDDNGEMIGSTLYMDFASRTEFDQWLESDPYYTEGVWVDIKIQPIKLAFRNT